MDKVLNRRQPALGKDVYVAPGVSFGAGVQVGVRTVIQEGAILYDHVVVGEDCVIGPHVILGEPEQAFYRDPVYDNGICRIGDRSILRAGTVVYANTELGAECETGSYAFIRERVTIGHHCRIGTFSDIQANCRIGNHVSFHSHVTVGSLSVVEDYAWLMPFVILLNDWYPPTCLKMEGPAIGKYAVVGANTTVYPGVTIGAQAVIGARSVVKTAIPDCVLAAGDPAQPVGDARKLVVLLDGKPVTPYPWMRHRSQRYPWERGGWTP